MAAVSTKLINKLNKITLWLTFGVLGALSLVMLVFAVIIRDFKYPKSHPLEFCVETLIMVLLPALAIWYFAHMRGSKGWHLWILVGSLAVKVLIAHLLFQFSGFYSWSMKAVKFS